LQNTTFEHLWPPSKAFECSLAVQLPPWPPTLVAVGSSELLAGDGQAFAAALKAHRRQQGQPEQDSEATCADAVADVFLECPGGAHDWPLLPLLDPTPGDASTGLDQIATFLARAVQRPLVAPSPSVEGHRGKPPSSAAPPAAASGAAAAAAAGTAAGEEEDWVAVEAEEGDQDPAEAEWLRRGKWVAFYEGTYAPHLPASAAASAAATVAAVAALPWRSHAPSSHLVAFVGCLDRLQRHAPEGGSLEPVEVGAASVRACDGLIVPRAALLRVNLRTVLEAGCGTGENACFLALRNRNCRCGGSRLADLGTAVVVGARALGVWRRSCRALCHGDGTNNKADPLCRDAALCKCTLCVRHGCICLGVNP
jgi:hypothetical protein